MVERNAGSQDGGQHHLVGRLAADALAQRSLNLRLLVIKTLGNLVCHDLTDPVEICAEPHRIVLHRHVAEFHHITVHQTWGAFEIYYFHFRHIFHV